MLQVISNTRQVISDARSWFKEVIERFKLMGNVADEISSKGDVALSKGSNVFDEFFNLEFPSGRACLQTGATEILPVSSSPTFIPTGTGQLVLNGGREFQLTMREIQLLAEAARRRINKSKDHEI